jgi:hypothetical protein
MTKSEGKPTIGSIQELAAQDSEMLREIVRERMRAMLEAEMDKAIGATKGERTDGRLGYRSGYYGRTLITRVGKPGRKVSRPTGLPSWPSSLWRVRSSAVACRCSGTTALAWPANSGHCCTFSTIGVTSISHPEARNRPSPGVHSANRSEIAPDFFADISEPLPPRFLPNISRERTLNCNQSKFARHHANNYKHHQSPR